MAVTGPPVSLNQAAGEFAVAAELRAVRVAAGLPAVGGMLDLIGKANFTPFTDLNLLLCGGWGLDRNAYFRFNFFNPADSGFTGSNGGISGPIWTVRASTDQINNAAKGIRAGKAMSGWASTNPRASLSVTQWPTIANGGVLLIDYSDWASGSGDSSCELYVSMS